jgi:hypothetical protein
MKRDWKDNIEENNLFRSNYCVGCKQTKPCYILNQEYCCACAFENEKARSQEYSNYEKVLSSKKREQKERFRQLQLLRNYRGCPKCGSKEVDAYELYENNRLVCQPCRMRKEGNATGAISFSEQSKWYKKQWGINLEELLKNFSQLPVNKNCSDQWIKDKDHLNNCDCLEAEAKELYLLFTNSLQKQQELLKKCSCKESEKIRVSDDNYAWCEICEKSISVASKKRVIKNRNDPKFWGLKVKDKVLCGDCLEQKKEQMPALRRAEFMRYRKVGRL